MATTDTFHIEMGPLSVQGLARFEAKKSDREKPQETPSVDIRIPEYTRTGENENECTDNGAKIFPSRSRDLKFRLY